MGCFNCLRNLHYKRLSVLLLVCLCFETSSLHVGLKLTIQTELVSNSEIHQLLHCHHNLLLHVLFGFWRQGSSIVAQIGIIIINHHRGFTDLGTITSQSSCRQTEFTYPRHYANRIRKYLPFCIWISMYSSIFSG